MNKSVIVSFDLDDTLYDNTPVIHNAFTALYDYLVNNYDRFSDVYSNVDRFINSATVSRQRYYKEFDFQRIRHLHIADCLKEAGHEEFDTEPAYQVFYDARQNVTLFDDVLDTLKTLKQHYVLISVSNGNAAPERIGLAGYFKQHFNPHNCGYAKPDPQLYQWVCQQLRIKPAQLIHVGDCLENDVAAAKNAGCRTIWFNPEGHLHTEDQHVQRISQLPSLIKKML